MALKWKRQDIEKLIALIEQHPCLYNIKCKEYLDRTEKALAFNEILFELKKSMSTIVLDDVKRKWRNVRSQFVQEIRMINHSKKSGSDIYVPKLWCYDQLSFLKTNTTMRVSKDNMEQNYFEEESISLDMVKEEIDFEEPLKVEKERSHLEDESSSSNMLKEETEFEEPLKKKNKCVGDINDLRNDLISLRQSIIEKKNEKKFAWLGALVVDQMKLIAEHEQADAAWQVQCLMRELTSKSAQNRKKFN